MKQREELSLEKLLGGLTKEQIDSLADQYNGGLGSGMTPEEWKKAHPVPEDKE